MMVVWPAVYSNLAFTQRLASNDNGARWRDCKREDTSPDVEHGESKEYSILKVGRMSNGNMGVIHMEMGDRMVGRILEGRRNDHHVSLLPGG